MNRILLIIIIITTTDWPTDTQTQTDRQTDRLGARWVGWGVRVGGGVSCTGWNTEVGPQEVVAEALILSGEGVDVMAHLVPIEEKIFCRFCRADNNLNLNRFVLEQITPSLCALAMEGEVVDVSCCHQWQMWQFGATFSLSLWTLNIYIEREREGGGRRGRELELENFILQGL